MTTPGATEAGVFGPPGLSEAHRRRSMAGLFGAVALAATGYIPAASVAPLVAEDLLGSATWSGLPGAVAVGGTALGATLLSAVMVRRSRNTGLTLGFFGAGLAVALAGGAVALASFVPFLIAIFLFGIGAGARHLARYAAGDLYGVARRGTAISFIVWGGTVGSVLGPLLLGPAQAAAEARGLNGLVGPFGLASTAFLLAAGLLWITLPPLPSPEHASGEQEDGKHGGTSSSSAREGAVRRLIRAISNPRAAYALLSLVIGQFVMVFLMSMTPIHIRHGGEGLGAVGVVFAAHTLGMFALSPLTGVLADSWGRMPVILAGQVMLVVAALMAAPTQGSDQTTLVISLFLLGLGWNFGFVAGSALLTESVPPQERLRLQGSSDTLVWTTAAVANLSSGWVLASGGYATLCLLGAALAIVPPLALVLARRRGSEWGSARP